jgi:predicted MFS family arabinose efflux permease
MTSPQLQRTASVGSLAAALTVGAAVRVLLPQGFFLLAPVLLRDLGRSVGAFGGLTVTLVVTGALLAPLTGAMADRFGARRLLLASFLTGAAAAVVAVSSPALSVLLVVLLAGCSIALAGPAAVAAVAVLVPPGRRGIVLGVTQAGAQVGLVVAALVLTRLSALFSWRAAVLFVLVLEGVGLVLTAGSVPDRPAALSRPALPPFLGRLAAYALLMGGGAAFFVASLPLFARELLELDLSGVARISLLVALVGGVALVLWGLIADSSGLPVPDLLVRVSAGATVGAALLAAASALGPAALLAGAVLVSATAVAWLDVGLVAVARDAHPQVAGQTTGWVLLASAAGAVLFPLLLGTAGFGGGFALVALTFAAATLLALAWSRSAAHTS